MFYSYLYGIETSQGSAKISKTFCFTRTFVELKRFLEEVVFLPLGKFYSYLYGIETFYRVYGESTPEVLLVPLWNWNKDHNH